MKISNLFSIAPFSFFLLLAITSGTASIKTHNAIADTIEESHQKNTLFDHLFHLEGIPKLKLTTNINRLIRLKQNEPFQEVALGISDSFGDELLTLTGKVRARGNMRKKVNHLPPLRLDLKKSVLDSLGFLKMDDLKLVLPGSSSANDQTFLNKEFLLYEIYSLIDSNYLRTKLVEIAFEWKGKEKYKLKGFLIEEEKEYKRRKNLQIVKKGVLRGSALNRESFLKMLFFQYMIANTDWSVVHMHNLEMVKLPNFERVVAMPYDFDYSGFVGQDYAVPNPRIPIKDVHERYFYPHYKMSEVEFQGTIDYYLSVEQEIYRICDQAFYMKNRTIKKSKKYLKGFFNLLRDSKKLQRVMVEG